MNIYPVSDLHLEFSAWTPPTEAVAAADVVVLAGDVALGTRGVAWAAEAFAGKPVIYVIGNHEFYGGNVSRTAIEIKRAAAGTNVTVLDNDALELGGVRFLGCTLWTDFGLFGSSDGDVASALAAAQRHVSDFSRITFGSTGWMTPAQSVILHRASASWLESRLEAQFAGPTVVVTHHAPSFCSVAPQWRRDIVSAAFASRLDDLVTKSDLWIHGHTHSAFDYRLGSDPGKGRLICNPRGYARDIQAHEAGRALLRCGDGSGAMAPDQAPVAGAERTGWNPGLIVEI